MTDASFTFGDLRCFADPSDARHYYFLPIAPDLQRDGDQRPMITMLDVGSSGHVMFTATWGARPASVDALAQEIAAGHQDLGAVGGGVALAHAQQHQQPGADASGQPALDRSREAHRPVHLRGDFQEPRHPGKWRVLEHPPHFQLGAVKSVIIMFLKITEERVLIVKGLDDDPAWSISAAGAAGNLHEQREDALG